MRWAGVYTVRKESVGIDKSQEEGISRKKGQSIVSDLAKCSGR